MKQVNINLDDILKIKEALLHIEKTQKYDKEKVSFLIDAILKIEQKANVEEKKSGIGKTSPQEPSDFDESRIDKEEDGSVTQIKEEDVSVTQIMTKFRQPYSLEEDTAILNYFLQNGGYSRQKGRAIWKQMSEQSVLPDRSWQSLKARWETINKNLDSYGVTAEQLKDAESIINEEEAESREVSLATTTNTSPRFSRGYRSYARYYTVEEDAKILGFIRDNKRFKETAGNTLWKTMEEQHVVPDRSWHSLKERFKKTIVVNIDKFQMSSEDLEAFKVVTQRKKKTKIPKVSEDESNMES